MKIDLTELLQKVGNEADIEETEDISFPDDGLNLTRPIKVSLHLINTGDSVFLTGNAGTEAELECSRCLKKYNFPIVVSLEEEFAREPFVPKSGGDIDLKPEDFVYPIAKDNTIDLTEILRQDLLLAMPIKTLCSQDCKGLDIKRNSGKKGEE